MQHRLVRLVSIALLCVAMPAALQPGIPQSPVITAQNAAQVRELGYFGRGWHTAIAWTDDNGLLVSTDGGVWAYTLANTSQPATWSTETVPPRPQPANGATLDLPNSDDQYGQPDPLTAMTLTLDGTRSRLVQRGLVWEGIFSPSGQKLLTVGRANGFASLDPNLLVLWDTSSGEPLWVQDNRSLLSDAAFSPDETQVALLSGDGAIEILDAAGRTITRFEGFAGFMNTWRFGAGGDLLLTSGRSITFWDYANGTRLGTAPGDVFDISAGDERVITVQGGALVVYNLDGYELARFPHPALTDTWAISIDISPDETRAAIATPQGAHLFDLTNGDLLATYGDSWVTEVNFSPDGALLAVAHFDPARDRSVLVTIAGGRISPLPGAPVDFSPDGARLALADYVAGSPIQVWDIAAGETVYVLGSGVDADFSPDGALLVTSGVQIWDMSNGALLLDGAPRLAAEGYIYFPNIVGFSPDGTQILAASDTLPFGSDESAQVEPLGVFGVASAR